VAAGFAILLPLSGCLELALLLLCFWLAFGLLLLGVCFVAMQSGDPLQGDCLTNMAKLS